jgi:hypothetical protein
MSSAPKRGREQEDAMLELYLGALAIGGTLLAATLILGGKGDTDHGGGGDQADHGGGHAHGHTSAGFGDGFDWLPVTSLRFWTFFLAFFGGTGAALYLLDVEAGRIATAAIATGVGWISGAGTVTVLRRLKRQRVDSAVLDKHLVGSSAKVLVEVARGRTGKVRIDSGSSVEDLLADTEDEVALPIGSQVMIYAGGEDGRVMITRAPEREDAAVDQQVERKLEE